jgi:hypothetical protein
VRLLLNWIEKLDGVVLPAKENPDGEDRVKASSPERSKLAEAIEELHAHEERVLSLSNALDAAREAAHAARGALDGAEATAAQAKDHIAAHALSTALGDGFALAPMSMEEARQHLTKRHRGMNAPTDVAARPRCQSRA